MISVNKFLNKRSGFLLLSLFIPTILISFGCAARKQASPADLVSDKPVLKSTIKPLKPEEIKVEMSLAKKWKPEDKTIKKKLHDVSVKRVKIQYFRFGDPPTNLVIGKDVPADIARLAIEIALDYNKDVRSILPEFRFFPHYIGIGSNAYDEQAEIPLFPEDLEKLRDPSLSTEAFHALYRSITGEDEARPTY